MTTSTLQVHNGVFIANAGQEMMRGSLTYEGPAEYGCVKYRHREKNKNQAYQFADAADAEAYAAKNNLVPIHENKDVQAGQTGV